MGNDFLGNYTDPVAFELFELNDSSFHRLNDDGYVTSEGVLTWKSPESRLPASPAPHSTHPPDTYLKREMDRVYSGAAPLAPLRQRDWSVLEDWFQADDMPEVEADILYNLLLRVPEPCWEDSVFDFLDEFL